MALPMTARSTRCASSAPIEAPTSSTTDSPLSVGQSAAMAGRSMPGSIFRLKRAIAISAPVLPAETATSASPFFTASMASHIDDFQRPWRSAWLGLSSMRMATSVWTTRERALQPRQAVEQRARSRRLSPNSMNSMSGWRVSEMSAPGSDHRRAMVAAHGVERDADLIGHGTALAARTPATPDREDPAHGGDHSGCAAASTSRLSCGVMARTGTPLQDCRRARRFLQRRQRRERMLASPGRRGGASNSAPGLRG